jgi:uncharacterized protein (TIGR00725 family)
MRIIGVIGAGECDASTYEVARQLGRLIARSGAALVCGGLFGVMEAASRGAKEAGGLTLALLPGDERRAANAYIDLAVPTGMGEGRNFLVVRAAEALIAVGGGYGTLSEIALGLKTGKRVIGLETPWKDVPGVVPAASPEEALNLALAP